MSSLDKQARIAGLLYLILVVTSPFRLVYIPGALFVSGNATATAHNIATHESLFRLGIFTDIWSATLEIFVVLALYGLLRTVNQPLALAMLVLGVLDVPVFFLNSLNDVGALLFSQGTNFLSAFGATQREAMVMFFISLHGYGDIVNEIFWGVWLLPFGLLVYRSGFLPRFIGVWLVLNGLAYVAQNVAGIVLPQFDDIIRTVSIPLQFGEIAITFWMLIMGARPSFTRPAPAPAP